MADLEEDKQAEKHEAIAEQGCAVRMHNGKGCGRPIHTAPSGVDEEPVCLMHSKDPNKSNAGFQEEFERILRDAGEGDADFTEFVFSSANYGGREFTAMCLFNHATFTQDADFRRGTFTQDAVFAGTMFTHDADFSEATFTQDADFRWARFREDAYFRDTTFTQNAHFFKATFPQRADFGGATFAKDAFFIEVMFTQDANFRRAKFTREACFEYAVFQNSADFFGATFKGRVEFRETKFREDGEIQPGPRFSVARFETPELVLFYRTYLGQALFHNCDVSRFQFSSVEWRGRPKNHKRMVLDEVIDTRRNDTAPALRTKDDNPNDRNYDLIAELYQQLKKNYDDKRDYWTAGDFHYGEMEMKRRSSPRRSPVLDGCTAI